MYWKVDHPVVSACVFHVCDQNLTPDIFICLIIILEEKKHY